MNAKITKLQSELNEEKEFNNCLRSKQDMYQQKLTKMEENIKSLSTEKDEEIKELKSQLRDIMFYLDAQNKISESKDITKEEIEQSHVVIQQDQAAGATGSNSTKSNFNRRKKK